MTGLYAANRETLAEAIFGLGRQGDYIAKALIDSGVVKVIDPDDDALVLRIQQEYEPYISRSDIRAVLRALVEDQP